jgi:hypothetical protein
MADSRSRGVFADSYQFSETFGTFFKLVGTRGPRVRFGRLGDATHLCTDYRREMVSGIWIVCLAGFRHGFKRATFLHWMLADINLTVAAFFLKLLA